jgi:aspartate aminotransferase
VKRTLQIAPETLHRETPIAALGRARRALAGEGENGRKEYPSMWDRDVISLAHGDGTRRPHPDVIAAGLQALLDHNRSLDNYQFLRRYEDLELAIEETMRRDGVPDPNVSQICIDAGTTRVFCCWLAAATGPQDLILVPSTYYHQFAAWCDLFDRPLAVVQTRPEHHYKLTGDDLERWFHAATTDQKEALAAIIVFNPSLSGALYTDQELAEVAEFVAANDLLAVEDRVLAHTEFARDQATRLAAFPLMEHRTITIGGVSKAHNLANARVGWACGSPDVIDRMREYSVATVAALPHVSLRMACAALRADRSYLRENAAECARRAALLSDLIADADQELRVRHDLPHSVMSVAHPPAAGHSLLLDLAGMLGAERRPGLLLKDSIDITRWLLSDAGVAVSPGASSGLPPGLVRVCFGSVGLSRTYPDARASELQAALRVLRAHRGLPATGPTARPGSPNNGFCAGRELIREAVNRITTACDRALTSHHEGSTERPILSHAPVT